MSVRIYVPIDSSALSLGAEKVAKAIAAEAAKRGIAIELGLDTHRLPVHDLTVG